MSFSSIVRASSSFQVAIFSTNVGISLSDVGNIRAPAPAPLAVRSQDLSRGGRDGDGEAGPRRRPLSRVSRRAPVPPSRKSVSYTRSRSTLRSSNPSRLSRAAASRGNADEPCPTPSLPRGVGGQPARRSRRWRRGSGAVNPRARSDVRGVMAVQRLIAGLTPAAKATGSAPSGRGVRVGLLDVALLGEGARLEAQDVVEPAGGLVAADAVDADHVPQLLLSSGTPPRGSGRPDADPPPRPGAAMIV
ncbi:hypothetical protein DL767_000683 [Monosporascus sp. MG133]|nr:hypothetical protein DL767_000683 [Monosporascus sp. MG133]